MIVIGASLGGVPALMHIAATLPRELGASVLAVLHVGEQPSILPALLATNSRLDVSHARDDEQPRPGHLYVAPPDQHMLAIDDRIVLTRGAKEHHTRPAIDPLFRSAALARGADAIGVVLTGLLDDGTAGLQEIKQRGGVAVVQDPEDAIASSMPASALANVVVDHCVPLALIPPLLRSLVAAPSGPSSAAPGVGSEHEQQITLQKGDPVEHLHAIGKPSTFACPDCHGTLWEILSRGRSATAVTPATASRPERCRTRSRPPATKRWRMRIARCRSARSCFASWRAATAPKATSGSLPPSRPRRAGCSGRSPG